MRVHITSLTPPLLLKFLYQARILSCHVSILTLFLHLNCYDSDLFRGHFICLFIFCLFCFFLSFFPFFGVAGGGGAWRVVVLVLLFGGICFCFCVFVVLLCFVLFLLMFIMFFIVSKYIVFAITILHCNINQIKDTCIHDNF